MTPIHKHGLATLVAAVLISTIPAARADAPKDIIKYREGVMKAVTGSAVAMKVITSGAIARKGDWLIHARAMVELARISADLYPKGTGPEAGKTRALPAIWEKPSEYLKMNEQWLAVSKRMLAAAEAGDLAEGKKAAKALSQACKDCHDPFRAKKKKKK
jgi:cytochrome c556